MRARLALLSCVLCLAAWARPPVVDAHTHIGLKRYGLAADTLASVGVTRFVNLSGGSPGRGLEAHLDAAAELDGRAVVCMNPRWRDVGDATFGEDQAALLRTAKALGARCLKISKALGLGVPDPSRPGKLLAVDDPRLDPLWAAAGALNMPVIIHTGDPKVFFEPLGPKNERMAELGVHPEWSFHDAKYPRRAALLAARDRVLAKHRGTTFIGVHFANNPEDLDYVEAALKAHPNLYLDVAARLPEIGRHDPARVRALMTRYADRILFGTDLGVTRGLMLGSVGRNRPNLHDLFLYYADHYRWFEGTEARIPHPTPIQGDWTIDAVGLSPEVLEKIYNRNALRLFWGETAPSALDQEALELAPGVASWL